MDDVTVLHPQQSSGSNSRGGAIVDFDFGSVSDFKRRLVEMKAKYDFLQDFFKTIMVKDEDYGFIPGTSKAVLFKPGAEKLCELYGFSAHVKSKTEERDFETGYYRVEFTLQLIHRTSGVVVGEGVGECSTFESKYRYRWVSENKVPSHLNKDDLLFEEKEGQYGPYKSYRIPNEDLHSQWNTVLKISYKRAYVGLTLQCTRSSGIFTQEESEMDEYAGVPQEDRKKERRSGGQGRTASANRGNGGGQSAQNPNKQRAYDLTKQITGKMDWDWLTQQAQDVLQRNINKVAYDVQANEWDLVVEYLEQNMQGGSQGEFDLPPDMR